MPQRQPPHALFPLSLPTPLQAYPDGGAPFRRFVVMSATALLIVLRVPHINSSFALAHGRRRTLHAPAGCTPLLPGHAVNSCSSCCCPLLLPCSPPALAGFAFINNYNVCACRTRRRRRRQMQSWSPAPAPAPALAPGPTARLATGYRLRVWHGMAWHGMAFINRSSFRRGHGMHTHNYFNMQFALHTPFPLYHAPSARQNGAECASAECAASGGKSTHASASASGSSSSSFSASTHRIAALRPAYTGVYFPYNEN